ncbi:hypothetical protein OG830_40115 [Streptomyces sp. NBC_00121]|uniref:hypothetical protein n=1 Tax=unclassified Streptomyces TaxID=2593676 RepID=UPI0028C3C18D|nr:MULTISPECIES: hypothetical protein [unclassified Streptomyces]WNO69475.1 hypothetical protein RPQ02_39790 [Streptomyces sp. AM2-3-1]WSC74253.1 hypothetical protein OG807_40790 [Streptomyces sp. NBC_01760]
MSTGSPFQRDGALIDHPSRRSLSREPVVYDAERVLRGQERLIEQGYGLVTTLISDQNDGPVGYTTMLSPGAGAAHRWRFGPQARADA